MLPLNDKSTRLSLTYRTINCRVRQESARYVAGPLAAGAVSFQFCVPAVVITAVPFSMPGSQKRGNHGALGNGDPGTPLLPGALAIAGSHEMLHTPVCKRTLALIAVTMTTTVHRTLLMPCHQETTLGTLSNISSRASRQMTTVVRRSRDKGAAWASEVQAVIFFASSF